MKIFKKLTALVLSLIILTGAGICAFAADADNGAAGEEFIPVLRFIASSDTHILSYSDKNDKRIGMMLDLAYEISEADPNYKALDALLVAGDLTNDGTKEEFDRFAAAVKGSIREGTEFIGVVAKNHDGYEMRRSELRDYYKKETGNEADFNVVINGYHFIGLSASSSDAAHYDAKQLSWLDEQIKQAVSEDPDKPVFVTHHEHNSNTVYGSSTFEGWGVPYFNPILNKYPQVVDFSGHSHYPLNHPGSVWQGKFTAIGTGAIHYSEFTIDQVRTYYPEDSDDTATFWIVELDSSNRMRLRGYDLLAGECLTEYILDNPADPANREYTPEKRKAASKPPVFDEGAAIRAEATPGGCKITAPAAKSADGMPVVLYRASAANSLGMTVSSTWTLPKYYIAADQKEIELELKALPKGDYKISVVAENAYGGDSEALTANVTVTESGCPYCGESHDGIAGKITLIFHYIAYFFAHLFGKK